jgi:hypothetical protein
MVSCEMHTALTSRIYKNGAKSSASEAVSPDAQWSILLFRAGVLGLWQGLLPGTARWACGV